MHVTMLLEMQLPYRITKISDNREGDEEWGQKDG